MTQRQAPWVPGADVTPVLPRPGPTIKDNWGLKPSHGHKGRSPRGAAGRERWEGSSREGSYNLPHPTPFSLNSFPLAASPGIHQGIPLVPQKREIQGEGGEWVVHNSRYTSAHFHNREQRPAPNLTVDHQELPNLNTGQSRPALGSGHTWCPMPHSHPHPLPCRQPVSGGKMLGRPHSPRQPLSKHFSPFFGRFRGNVVFQLLP